MTRAMTLTLTCLISLATLTLSPPTPALAQGLGDLATRKEDPALDSKREQMQFKAGSVDMLIGVGGFLYPHIEPGIEIGVLNLPSDISIGLGANLDLGYCLGCLLGDLIDDVTGSNYETELRSWYVAPQLRVLVHFGIISRIAKMPELDVFGGIGAGPALWNFSFEVTDKTDNSNTAKASSTSLAAFGGPIIGLRYLLSESFFVSFEARYFISVTQQNTTVNVGNEQVLVDTEGTVQDRYGSNYNLAVGLRF